MPLNVEVHNLICVTNFVETKCKPLLLRIFLLWIVLGICSEIILRPKEISQEELLDLTGKLNKNSRVSGILVQLPLPGNEFCFIWSKKIK